MIDWISTRISFACKVVRNSLQSATLGLYATMANTFFDGHDTLPGYQRASKLGLFDHLDILVPIG